MDNKIQKLSQKKCREEKNLKYFSMNAYIVSTTFESLIFNQQ